VFALSDGPSARQGERRGQAQIGGITNFSDTGILLLGLCAALAVHPDHWISANTCRRLESNANSHKDKKCPFTGLVSIRGRILTGTVVSTKMHRTIIIRREYLHYVPKYDRYEKRHKNIAAHVSPAFRVEEGDQVTVGQCRPLSKTVREDFLLQPNLA
jgi:ribosomal protein uS17